MAVERTPVELWEKILRYSISVPLFFDTDPADNYGVESLAEYHSESVYWNSERIRNAMRRVCSDWDTYLRTLNSWYVRLQDVHDRYISDDAIPQAIRLNTKMSRHDRKIIFSQLLQKTDNDRPIQWKLEILYRRPVSIEEIEKIQTMIPKLRVVTDVNFIDVSTLSKMWSGLRFLSVTGPAASTIVREFNSYKAAAHLTTLKLTMESIVDVDGWARNLLSLRHLSLSSNRLGRPLTADPNLLVTKIFHAIGKHLRSFFLTTSTTYPSMADSTAFWKLVPNLEAVQLPYRGMIYPPDDHSIRFFRIYLRFFQSRCDPATTEYYRPSFPGISGAAYDRFLPHRSGRIHWRVRMDQQWDYILFGSSESWIYTALRLVEIYKSYSMEVLDVLGVRWDEYLVSLIEDCHGTRRNRTARRRALKRRWKHVLINSF